jgi:hypothetical protein
MNFTGLLLGLYPSGCTPRRHCGTGSVPLGYSSRPFGDTPGTCCYARPVVNLPVPETGREPAVP